MTESTWHALLSLGLLTAVLACAPGEESPAADAGAAANEPGRENEGVAEARAADRAGTPARARARLAGADGSGVSGSVEVRDDVGGARVVVHVTGITPPGPHGIHIHDGASCERPDFTSAGEHWNPSAAPHACPPASPRHAGDLGNVEVAEGGEGHLELQTDLFTAAEGPSSVVGRAIILHGGADDCSTQPSGESGERLACGVFERVDE